MRALLALVLLAAACKPAPIGLVHRELPGFGIDLPEPVALRKSTIHYVGGELVLSGTYRGETLGSFLRWSLGYAMSHDQLVRTAQHMTPTNDGRAQDVAGIVDRNGHPVQTVGIDADRQGVLLSKLECGKRTLLVATTYVRTELPLHRRVIASLTCHPDAEEEKALDTFVLPIALDLPGWHAKGGHTADQLVLSSPDGASIVSLWTDAILIPETLLDHMDGVLRGALNADLVVGQRQGDVVNLTGTLEGAAVVGYARVVSCDGHGVIEVALSKTKDEAIAVTTQLQKATCLPPGGKSPVWPDEAGARR